MKALLRMELEKALRSRWFAIALAIGCAFAAASALLYIVPLFTSRFTPSPDKFYYPTSESCFNAWMSIGTTSVSLLFYQLLPLLAVVPYAWSLRSELMDGYISQVYSRTRRARYLAAKYVAVVCAGGLVAVVPQLLNFIMLACFYPAYLPEIITANMYSPVFWQSIGSWLFYNIPLAYVLFYCLIDFVLCGLWAGFVLALSCFVRNRVVLLVAPYLFLLALDFVNARIFVAFGVRGFQLSLFDNLYASASGYVQNGWIILGECAVLFAVAAAILAACRNRDAL